jgi:hypothetical protein
VHTHNHCTLAIAFISSFLNFFSPALKTPQRIGLQKEIREIKKMESAQCITVGGWQQVSGDATVVAGGALAV